MHWEMFICSECPFGTSISESVTQHLGKTSTILNTNIYVHVQQWFLTCPTWVIGPIFEGNGKTYKIEEFKSSIEMFKKYCRSHENLCFPNHFFNI